MNHPTHNPFTIRAAIVALVFIGALTGTAHAATDDATLKLNSTNGSTQFTVQNANASGVVYVNSAGTVLITSNTILAGTSFYQSGSADIGVAGTAGNYITLNGGVTYPINDLGTTGGAVTFDCSKGTVQRIIMNASVTATITNPVAGQPVIFRICSNATGGWTFTWPANVTATLGAITPTASRCTSENLIYDGVNLKFYSATSASANQL